MTTSEEYLELSERYRIAKLGTRDKTVRHQLETFEHSYFVLAKSLQVLAQSNAVREIQENRKK